MFASILDQVDAFILSRIVDYTEFSGVSKSTSRNAPSPYLEQAIDALTPERAAWMWEHIAAIRARHATPFTDIMGLDGWYEEYLDELGHYTRRYYAATGDGRGTEIAYSFGFAIDDHVVDFDGDGVTELVCNCTYAADSVDRVYVYRRIGNELMEGWMSYDSAALSDRDTLRGVGATVERYDPETGFFTLEYLTRGGGQNVARFTMDDLEFRSYAIVSPDGTPTLFVNGGDTMLVYRNLLSTLYDGLLMDGKAALPDGGGLLEGSKGEQSENKFAVCDVDGDGTAELLFRYTTAPTTAGMKLYVYHYNVHKGLRFEFSEFPRVTFYDNGTLTAGWSHGGPESEPWPYNAYRYDAETDSYRVVIGSVEAWVKAVRTEFNYEFPDDADVDGDGTVYAVYTEHEDGVVERDWLDNAAYDAWVASWRGGAREIIPEWRDFTAQNIAALT